MFISCNVCEAISSSFKSYCNLTYLSLSFSCKELVRHMPLEFLLELCNIYTLYLFFFLFRNFLCILHIHGFIGEGAEQSKSLYNQQKNSCITFIINKLQTCFIQLRFNTYMNEKQTFRVTGGKYRN